MFLIIYTSTFILHFECNNILYALCYPRSCQIVVRVIIWQFTCTGMSVPGEVNGTALDRQPTSEMETCFTNEEIARA